MSDYFERVRAGALEAARAGVPVQAFMLYAHSDTIREIGRQVGADSEEVERSLEPEPCIGRRPITFCGFTVVPDDSMDPPEWQEVRDFTSRLVRRDETKPGAMVLRAEIEL